MLDWATPLISFSLEIPMKKQIFLGLGFVCLVVVFSVPSTFGQKPRYSSASQPFGLKGDVLGETLQEFRLRNARIISSQPNAPLASKKYLPQCTNDKIEENESLSPDVDGSAETEDEQRAGVIKCIAALSMDDDLDFDDGPTVAGIAAYRTIYYFFHERLYKVESELPRSEYRVLRREFIAKYGPPIIAKTVPYQNGFGAAFSGERLLWRNSFSNISIGELDGQSNNIRIVFWHYAIGKQCEIAGAAKGRAKDL
jgi:hypothetical protein